MVGRDTSKKVLTKIFYPSLVLACLFLSYLIPSALSRKHFKYSVAGGSPLRADKRVDMKTRLLRITPGSNGERVSLEELVGQAQEGILVNFWATWCAPCLEELPALESMHRQLSSGKGIKLPKLVTISVDEKRSDITALYKTLPFQPSFEVLHDPDGTFAESLGTTRFPETYWIKLNGQVTYKWLGPQFWLSESILRRLASY
jgi:thiol-disulfide isomerase/thioredoxin